VAENLYIAMQAPGGLVTLVGFKFKPGAVLIPLIFVGVVRSCRAETDVTDQVRPVRDIIETSVSCGRNDVAEAAGCAGALRRLDGVSHDVARTSPHLRRAFSSAGK